MKDRAVLIVPNAMQSRELLFCPMLTWVLSAVQKAGYMDDAICFADRLDTADLAGKQVLLLPANMPLITPEIITDAGNVHMTSGAEITLIGDETTGAAWVDGSLLSTASAALAPMLAKAEEKGIVPTVYAVSEQDSLRTASNAKELFTLHQIAAKRVLEQQLENGTEILSDAGVLIDPRVKIDAGCIIYPGTILKGETVIGENCILGPNTVIRNSTIGNGCEVNASQIEDSVLENNINMGPFAHIRPGSHIGNGVHLGNFTEVKNSTIGDRTAVSHLTYVGDSDVGEAVNFGCGCVTVNYDGQNKHRTTIGNHAFIGCNTNLVAPVTVADFGYTAAGSTITENVPEKALAIARARQYNKEGWAEGKIKIK